MKNLILRRIPALLSLLLVSSQVHAGLAPTRERLPNYDKRSAQIAAAAPPEQQAAVAVLRAEIPNAKVEFDSLIHAPKMISAPDGFLTGPSGQGRAVPAGVGARFAGDPDRATKAFIDQHRGLLGHGPEVLSRSRVTRNSTAPRSGLRTVVWQQEAAKIPVFESILISHTTAAGELVTLSSSFVPDAEAAAEKGMAGVSSRPTAPTISPRAAIKAAAENVGDVLGETDILPGSEPADDPELRQKFTAPGLQGETSISLVWLPLSSQELRLAWDVIFTSRSRGEMFRSLVDAKSGEVLLRRCLTEYLSDASFRVYTSDSPTPFSPGFSTPVSSQPAAALRTLVTLSALNTNASPNGWINDGGNETVGNNVDAHTDRNDDDVADLPRPQGSPFRTFDFAMDPTVQNPTSYSNASVVQLFYLCNWMHDRLYELGFTESAGNFQVSNFGRGGLGNDSVQADAQDGGGFNNANFSTPPDGSPGRMQMYLFNGPTPDRDGDFDAEIVLHEYTHGLSNRRVGGGVGMSALQSEGMGEGWSDFYGLALLSEAGDDVNGCYAAGGYATYQLSGLTQNYYYGIRRYPYSTDMSKNPLTFKDINPAQASTHAGIPRSPIIGTTADEVHNMGEVWCVTLWEARANLIGKYGWNVGNQLILQLVTDGMNLSPPNPNFLQARDAILQADLVNNGGANRAELWVAFAKRGLGFTATSPSSSTTSGLKEAFDVPDTLIISPAALSSVGPVGGPFSPNPAFLTLTNSSASPLTWNVTSSSPLITVSPANGTLTPGTNTPISVGVNGAANNLSLGTTNLMIWFTNQTSGIFQSRTFSLNVVGRSLYEDFEPGIHLSLWSAFGGTVGTTVIANNSGGSVSGLKSLWFGDTGTRSATTIPIDTTGGGSIGFYLRLGNGVSAPWETVDLPAEGVVLEYSTNATTWTIAGTYNTSTFYNWTPVTLSIPSGALSVTTQFRWRQLSHSGTCCDHWALDDISIDAGPTPPMILVQPSNRTLGSGSNLTMSVSVQGSSPLSFQWSRNGTNLFDGGRVSGATSSTLNIATLLESDSGQYSVFVTNLYGSVVSSNATLLVTPLHHFEWSLVPSPQAVGVPFSASIIAKDFSNATVTNFQGTVGLSALNGFMIGSFLSDNFEDGDFSDWTIGSGAVTRLVTTNTAAGGTQSFSIIGGVSDHHSGIWHALSNAQPSRVNFSVRSSDASQSGGYVVLADATNGVSPQNANTAVFFNMGPSGMGLVEDVGGAHRVPFVANQWYQISLLFNWTNRTVDYYVNDALAFSGVPFRGQSVSRLSVVHFYNYNSIQAWWDEIEFLGGTTPSSISLTPTTGNFTNGIWTGSITVQQPATNLVLSADDGSGHSGSSNPFDVLLQNDISIGVVDAPDPVSIGANLTYTLTVANAGPAAASNVNVTNFLSAGVTFVSATASQGSCAHNSGVVTCNLGSLAGATNATITITVVPNVGGMINNSAFVARGEADALAENNSSAISTLVQVPMIAISDTSVLEGKAGQVTNAFFTVSLNAVPTLPVMVNYVTANGSALAGSDYIGTTGILSFAAGETNKTIAVLVKGDADGEANETFFVTLTAPTNALVADAQGLGTILNDDVPSAAYVRSTVSAPWGSTSNESAMNRVFGTNNWQDLRYETLNTGLLFSPLTTFIFMEGSDGDATELEAFLTANLGALQNWVSNGGSLFLNAAPNEDNGMDFGFGVTLAYSESTATGVSASTAHPIFNTPFIPVGIAWTGNSFAHAIVTGAGLTKLITNSATGNMVLGEKAYGAGQVLFGGMTTDNFHSPQPQASNLRANILAYLNSAAAYRFEWQTIASPQLVGVPFPVTITARGSDATVDTNFNDQVVLTAISGGTNSVFVSPANSGNFTNGIWSGEISVLQPGQGIVLTANSDGHAGSANPIAVNAENDLSISAVVSPAPILVGSNFTYTLTVANSGPALATGVMLTNILPSSVAFVSATASQGNCVQNAGVVVCDAGTVNGETNATVTIVVSPLIAGTALLNTSMVSRTEAEVYLANNFLVTSTMVNPPELSISNSVVAEGNIGTTHAVFNVTLSASSAQIVSVNFNTISSNATVGIDCLGTNGILFFPAGITNRSITVKVNGDVQIESNEVFLVTLSNSTNCLIMSGTGSGTILNDDGLPGEIYSLVWNPISSAQYVDQPFAATLTALDVASNTVTAFSGSVALDGLILGTAIPIVPSQVDLTNGLWSGSVVVSQRATNLMLRVDDGNGHVGLSSAFHVIASNQPPLIVSQPTNTSGFLGGSAILQVNAYGPGPISYQWRLNGADVEGGTNAILNLNRLTLDQAGSYSVVASNAFGGTISSKALLSLIQAVAWGAGTNNTGSNLNYGQSQVPPGLTNVARFSGGLYHTVALKNDGTLAAWGAGTNSTQQNPNYGQSIAPGIGNVVAVAAGGYHTLALRSDRTVVAWGAGTNNIQQTPFTGQSIVPAFATNIIAIAAGDYHSVALRADGRVLVWGFNSSSVTNVPAAATSNVVAIASRGTHVLALKSDGTMVHWGNQTSLPPTPGPYTNVVAIAAGVNHCLALKNDGTVMTWGGQFAIPFGLSNVVEIAAGLDHSIALRSDGGIVTWGATNSYGRFLVPALSNFVGVAAGAYHSLGVLAEGAPTMKYPPVSRNVLLGGTALFSALAVGPQLQYQWQRDGTNLPKATNFLLSIAGARASDAGNYRVILTNAFGSVTSSVASLTVLAPLASSLDASGLVWTTNGNAGWFGQTAMTHDGVDAAQSGSISNGQQTALQTTVAGPGSATFWWKVSSEEYFDSLNFTIDGVLQDGISGEGNWQQRTYPYGAGSHVLRWSYVKDSGVSVGLDAAWLDQLLITTNPPVVLLHPVSQTNGQGGMVQFLTFVSGAAPFSYQWLKGGTNLPGETSSALTIYNLARRDNGFYAVSVSNPGGSTVSSNAFLKVYVAQQLTPAGMQPDGSFLLRSADSDGGSLSSADLPNFEVQASTNLFDWTTIPSGAMAITNGSLLILDSESTNYPARYYRVLEY